MRIERRVIDFLAIERLAKTGGGSALDDHERPAVILTQPALDNGDEFFLGGGILLERQGELEHQEMEVGLRLTFLNEISGKIGEAFRFPGRPEGQFVGEGNGLAVKAGKLRFGGLTVKMCESGKIAGKDGGAPLVKRREGKGIARWKLEEKSFRVYSEWQAWCSGRKRRCAASTCGRTLFPVVNWGENPKER